MQGRKIVDLFAGPGGLDVSARWLGVPAVGVEIEAKACETRKAAGLDTHQSDVRSLGPDDFKDADVLAGGPPCQTYTVAGSGTGRAALARVTRLAKRMAKREDVSEQLAKLDRKDKHDRTGLVLEPLRWVLEAVDLGRPYQAIVLEQVQAALPVWHVYEEILDAEGYSVLKGVLRAEEYGVPQTRRRAVLVARPKTSGEAAFPEKTHRLFDRRKKRAEGDEKRLPWVGMGDILDRGEPFEVVSNYGTGGDPKERGRRRSDQPAFTVTGRVDRNRVVADGGTELGRFSFAEAGQLQSFPAAYPWSGLSTERFQQIGNAIPPILGLRVLATALDATDEQLTAALERAAKCRAAPPDAADWLSHRTPRSRHHTPTLDQAI